MKNTFLSLVVLIGLLPGTGFISYSQNTSEKVPIFSVGADIKKGYYWRGLDLEHKGSFQPYIEASLNNFTLGAWSAFRITGGGSDEIDLYISKEIGPVTITLFDYWSYRKDAPSCYFDFDRQTTSHLLECQVMLTGGEKIPINFLASWLAWGSDPSASIYLELQYTQPLFEGEALLYAGYQAKGNYYAEKPAFVSTGVQITYPLAYIKNNNLEIFADLMGNPWSKKLFFNFGLSFYR